jgi:hypothetical protein
LLNDFTVQAPGTLSLFEQRYAAIRITVMLQRFIWPARFLLDDFLVPTRLLFPKLLVCLVNQRGRNGAGTLERYCWLIDMAFAPLSSAS